MRFDKLITTVDSHTEGMPTRVVTSGFGPVPGQTMFEKKRYVEEHLDYLRTRLMFEPRGHSSMSGSILLPPTNPEADLGVVFIEVSGCLPMCGHGTIGTVTVALETGLLPRVEPITYVTLDTPAGLVRAEATIENDKVKRVKIRNVPAFLYRQDVTVDVPGFGPLVLDLAYGGNFYAILPADAVGLSLEPRLTPALIEAGMRIMAATSEQIPIEHPVNPGINELKHVLFTGPAQVAGAAARNAVIIYPGTVDRSPCGTGTSARMAQLYGRGQLSLHQPFVHESLIGTTFTGELVEEVNLNSEVRGVIPTIEGRAWITGFNQLVLDPDDPFPAGFLVG